jgi:hypothetical protein
VSEGYIKTTFGGKSYTGGEDIPEYGHVYNILNKNIKGICHRGQDVGV